MRRAERVVDVVLGQVRQLPGELLVVGFFFGVEAQVLEQQRLALFQLRRDFLGFRADALGTEADVLAARQFLVEQHAQPLGHRLQTHLGIGLALGPAQVRSQNQARPVAQRIFDGGQGFADAGIVHDAPVFQRHVEIDAHENAVAVERKITNGKLGHGWSSSLQEIVKWRGRPRPRAARSH